MKAVLRAITPAPLWELAREVVTRMKSPRAGLSVTQYWTEHLVHSPLFTDQEASRNFIDWRTRMSLGYAELMPFTGHDGKTVLDYGCGPGIELTGIGLYSKPKALYGADISSAGLEKARLRTQLHGIPCQLLLLKQGGGIPLESASVDFVHCSGVLHHTPDPVSILKEFARILVPGGTANVMIYNYASIYMHLYVAYMKRVLGGKRYRRLSKEEVFRISTDGPTCPISRAYRVEDFIEEARTAGLQAAFKGAGMENGSEMKTLNLRWDAIADARLDPESRAFLDELTFDERGRPVHRGRTAGVHACYQLTKVR
jgi:ubiquinone/menaquinone biosynthesis C-methylase UbiE